MTFISELARAGGSPRTIVALARHRDYRLTATVYTDVRVIDTFGAAAQLPDDGHAPERSTQAARRSDTDDSAAMAAQGQDPIQDQQATPERAIRFNSVR